MLTCRESHTSSLLYSPQSEIIPLLKNKIINDIDISLSSAIENSAFQKPPTLQTAQTYFQYS